VCVCVCRNGVWSVAVHHVDKIGVVLQRTIRRFRATIVAVEK